MKRLLSIVAALFLALFCGPVFGQKIDIDLEDIAVKYIRMPLKPLSPEFKTYSTTASIPYAEMTHIGLTENGVQTSNLNVEGYTQVPKGGHFHIEVIADAFKVSANTSKSRVVENKDKAGKVTKTNYTDLTMKGTQNVSLKITDFNQTVIEEKVFCSTSNEKTLTKTYNSVDEMNKAYTANTVELRRQTLGASLESIRQHLAVNYGWVQVKNTKDGQLEILDSKKHDDYDAWQSSMKTAQNAFQNLTPTGGIDQVRTDLKPAIEFWEAGLNKYPTSDEKMAKLHHSCLYNLASVSYWLDDFSAAEKYIAAMKKIDWQNDRTEDWEKLLAKTRADLDRCKVSSIHVDRAKICAGADVPDVTYSTQKAEAAAARAEAAEARAEARAEAAAEKEANTERFEGTITDWAGKTTTVEVSIVSGPNVSWLPKGNITYKAEGEKVGRRMDPEKVKELKFNDRTFRSINYKSASSDAISLGSSKKKTILEVLFDSEKVAVYRAYKHVLAPGTTEGAPEFALQKKKGKDTDLQSTSTLGFTLKFKKNLAEFFEDCPDLDKKCSDGEYTNGESDLIQAAAFYTNDCK